MINEEERKEINKVEDNDELIINLPNTDTIPCLTCKWGRHDYLAMYCVKYHLKPKNVYYESEKCEKYEKFDENL